MAILGIETSCDDTALALYCEKTERILAEVIGTQTALHNLYGGVVPELASRDHLRQILPLLKRLLSEASVDLMDLGGVAYTAGPGLLGAVMVGASFGRSLAMACALPSIGIHHIEGHLLSVMLCTNRPRFPFLALIVSGGHTLLVEVRALGQYHLLGGSLDDAAGEAFDKTAKLMGLAYPGGPEIERLAHLGTGRLIFPVPMANKPGYDFSFSGLKTHVRQVWVSSLQTEQDKADIAQALQVAVTEALLLKVKRALKVNQLERFVLVGGVSANQFIRTQFETHLQSIAVQVYFPEKKHSTDNAAMIAYAGAMRLARGERDENLAINAQARWSLA